MNPYLKILNQYLAEYPLDYRFEDTNSILEFLARFYLTSHPIESSTNTAALDSLGPILKQLSQKRTHRLFRVINDLCIENKKAGFIEGTRVGAQLALELTQQVPSLSSAPK